MSVLTLGGFQFQEWELPEEIPLPNRQCLKVWQHPGGMKIVDAMGPEHPDISWSGRFRRAEALGRMQVLAAMCNSGQRQELSVLGLSYTVVVKEFLPKAQRGGLEIPYTIALEVVQNNQTSATPVLASLDSLVSSDFAAGMAALFPPAPTLVSLSLPKQAV